MNTTFTKRAARMRMHNLPNFKFFTLISFLFLNVFFMNMSLSAQCPTTSCATHTSTTNTGDLPECGDGSVDIGGNIDNNSDCENSGNDNCWKFVIVQHDPQIRGITADIGKGNGCNGEVDVFYTEINGVCTNQGSSGSQNEFSFEFGDDGVITLWLCDGSSGQVSLCDLCAEPLIPAPVEMSQFIAIEQGKNIDLFWQTASETNNRGFEIQRSTNGTDWESIGFEVSALGTTVVAQDYSFTDERPYPGSNYYRLKQMDFDGQFEYSEVREVLMAAPIGDNLQIFPNPSNGKFTLGLHNPNGKRASIKLFDSTGSMIWEERFSNDEAQPYWEQKFDLPQYEVYFIVTQIGDQIETEKVVVIDQY